MLRELRGTEHQVTTGVTVTEVASGRSLTDTVTSNISLRNFSRRGDGGLHRLRSAAG